METETIVGHRDRALMEGEANFTQLMTAKKKSDDG